MGALGGVLVGIILKMSIRCVYKGYLFELGSVAYNKSNINAKTNLADATTSFYNYLGLLLSR